MLFAEQLCNQIRGDLTFSVRHRSNRNPSTQNRPLVRPMGVDPERDSWSARLSLERLIPSSDGLWMLSKHMLKNERLLSIFLHMRGERQGDAMARPRQSARNPQDPDLALHCQTVAWPISPDVF